MNENHECLENIRFVNKCNKIYRIFIDYYHYYW